MAKQQNPALTAPSSPVAASAAETAEPSRQQVAEGFLRTAGSTGMTWKEFDKATGWNHHGRSTAALSAMHKSGRLARLKEQREKCSVYVLPEHVDGRATSEYGPSQGSKVTSVEVTQLRERNEKLFVALDNLSHAAGFKNHRHVWVEEAKSCFLCQAREAVAAERTARGGGLANGAEAKSRAAIAAGAVLAEDSLAS